MAAVRGKRTVVQQLLNPPFNRTFVELGGLNDDQLLFLYAVKRGPDGVMEIDRPPARWPSLQELHARRCFMLGITEPWKVQKLWREEQVRRKAAQEAAKRRRSARAPRPRGRGAKKGGE